MDFSRSGFAFLESPTRAAWSMTPLIVLIVTLEHILNFKEDAVGTQLSALTVKSTTLSFYNSIKYDSASNEFHIFDLFIFYCFDIFV